MTPPVLHAAEIDRSPAEARLPHPARMERMEAVRGGIRSNLVWMVAGTVWAGVCQWALLIVLAKLGSVTMVGTYTLGVAIALPVLMFSCLNLRNLFVTDHACEYRFREYFTLRLLTAFGSVLLMVLFAVSGGSAPAFVSAIFLIGLAKAIEYVSDMLYGLFQRQESMAAMSISMIVRGTLSLGMLSLGVSLTGSLVWGASGLVISSAATLLAFDIPVSLARTRLTLKEATKEFAAYVKGLFTRTPFPAAASGWRRLRSLAMAGAPLGLVLMLVSLNVNIPRYFVERSFGIREQGMFSSLANLIAAGSVVIGSLGQSATPRLAKSFATGNMRAFRSLLRLLLLVSLSLGLAGFALAVTMGRQVLTIIYRPEYAARADVFIWLMAASGAIYLGSSMGVALTAVRCFAPQLPLFAVAAASTAVFCMVLVPRFGLRGAAVSILISALIQSGGGAWLLWRACRPAVEASA